MLLLLLFHCPFVFYDLLAPAVDIGQYCAPIFIEHEDCSLSTWEEAAWLRKFRPRLPLGTYAPGHCGDTEDHGCHDRGVGFPVGWLSVPASRW